ncbi:MAG TPA: hypothetical protein VN963_04780 [bacterium]|nr:hypothetical protein [bacterium]
MNKTAVFLTIVLALTPCVSRAVVDQEWEDAQEIGQQWVNQHNAKLSDLVKTTAQSVYSKRKNLLVPSLRPPELAKKSLKPEDAESFGIPSQAVAYDGVTVDLMELHRTLVDFTPGDESVFITAEYYDELNPIHSSSDIYMKIGQKYFKFFHGEGYRKSAEILSLDQTDNDSVVFFDIGQYGGGSQVRKTIYGLNQGAVASISQTLFDNPEKIRKEDYVCEKLTWTVSLAGATIYRDISGDGMIEILNLSEESYPADLRAKLHDKYGFVNTDFVEPFRKTLTIYQWDDPKQQFDELGEYYY